MSDIPAAQISIEVSVSCEAWLAALSDTEAVVEAAARAALGRAGAPTPDGDLVLDITLTDDAKQRRLNHAYRGKDAATNVLAFPLADPEAPALPGRPVLLGDVVLAFETVRREAAEQHKPLSDHLRHLVVHGTLHLLGFDHRDEAEAAAMEAREIEILARLGVPNPYADIK